MSDLNAQNQREVYLQARAELALPHPAITLPDWPAWNKLTGGFRMREFTVFCGPTGTGKTTFLANLSAQLLKQGTKHFIMSVETGHTDFMKRVLSVLAGRDLNTGEAVSLEVLERLHEENRAILESDTIEFSLYEDRLPVQQLIADVTQMVQVNGCKIVMVDNLNFLMDVTNARDQFVEMDRVTHSLVAFCKQIDVHLILVMHPKKTEGGRVDSEFDIKGSSTAVQEAHNVLLFNRPRPDALRSKTMLPYDRELTLAKMRRRGVNVGKTIIFSGETTRYSEKAWLNS